MARATSNLNIRIQSVENPEALQRELEPRNRGPVIWKYPGEDDFDALLAAARAAEQASSPFLVLGLVPLRKEHEKALLKVRVDAVFTPLPPLPTLRYQVRQLIQLQKRRRSSKRWLLLAETLQEGLAVVNGKGRILYANATARRMLGLSSEGSRFPHSLDKPSPRPIIIRNPDGTSAEVEMQVHPIQWEPGNPARAVTLLATSEALARARESRDAAREGEQKALCEAEWARQHYRSLFEYAPGAYLVLKPDHFEIAAVSEEYLKATSTRREQLQGQQLFQIFPDDPGDPKADGTENLRKSLNRVLKTRQTDIMPVQRYPIPRPESRGGGFEIRYWSPVNTPVPGPHGEVAYLIHRVEDVTDYVNERKAEGSWQEGEAVFSRKRDQVEADIVLRGYQLKKANEELQARQTLLRIASRAGRIGGWTLKLPEYQLEWSEEIRDIHEVPPHYQPTLEEAIEFYPEEYRQQVSTYVENCIRHGEPFDFEMELITARNRRIWVRAIGEPVRAEDGSIIRLQGAFQDISERKATAESLQASERRFRQLAEAMPFMVWSADPDGAVNYVNHHFFEFTGISPREPAASRWQQTLHPDDVEACLESWKTCVRQEAPFQMDYRIRQIDSGSYHWFRVQATPVRDLDGKVYQYYGSAIDIDTLVRLEKEASETAAKLRETLESITNGFFSVDRQWQFTYINAEFERIVQKKRENLLGVSLWEAFPGTLGTPFEKHYREAMDHQTSRSFEAWFDPLQKWFEVHVYPTPSGLSVYFSDVTQRHQREEQLRLLESSVSRINDIILITRAHPIEEPGPEIVYVNNAFQQVTGYSREEALGENPRFLQGPETDRAALDRIQKALRQQKPIREEIINYDQAGQAYWIQLDIAPVVDPSGKTTHFVAVQRDVTGEKNEETIRDQETRLLTLVSRGTPAEEIFPEILAVVRQLVPDAIPTIQMADSDKNDLVSVTTEGLSEAFQEATRAIPIREGSGTCGTAAYRKEVVITENIAGDPFWEGIHEVAEQAGLQSCWSSPVLDGAGEILATFALYHRVPHRPDDFEQDLCRRLAYLLHLTLERDRKAQILQTSEERFRLVAKATNDAIWDWDIRNNSLWWNEGFEILFGYPLGQLDPNLESWSSHIHPEDRQGILDQVHKTIESGKQQWSGEYRFQKYDGYYANVADRGFVLYDSRGNAVRMIGGMTDLTERKNLERQFLRAQRLESIGTLAGGIAHDLNNLLTPITMGVSLLKRHAEDPRETNILESIEHNANRGSNLVKQILSFARGQEGIKVPLHPETLIQEVEAMVQTSFPKNIRPKIHREPDLWKLCGDPTQLNQVLLNLCVNARDAMPDGGPLTLSAENVELDEQYLAYYKNVEPGPFVLIEVSDEGQGMSREILDRIFEPFFTTKELGHGTGLGLSTAMSIIRGHQGLLTAYSEIGKGTSFKIYLPAHIGQSEPAPKSGPRELPPEGRGELILVVDDEASILNITEQSLKAHGYRVLTAQDGARAVSLYAAHQEDVALVLTDIMMPIMDGPALMVALKEINPDVKIIAASGLKANGRVAKAESAGVHHFLPKPYSGDNLLHMIHTVLHPPDSSAPPNRQNAGIN